MRRIAIINQKGGVGKTTTTVNLAAALADMGRTVQVIDLDPQAHATLHLGVEIAPGTPSVYDLLANDASLSEVRRQVEERLWIVGSQIDLAAAEVELAGVVGREIILRDLLDQEQRSMKPAQPLATPAPPAGAPLTGSASLPPGDRPLQQVAHQNTPAPDQGSLPQFDYTIMDCPPSLGVLTLNALTAADEVIIPLQPHFLALHGLSKLLETIALVWRRINHKLSVTGIVLCMVEQSTRLCLEVVEDLERYLESGRARRVPWANAIIFNARIRRNIRLAECPSFGQSIFRYAPKSHGAEDYRALAAELDSMQLAEPVRPAA